MRACTVKCKEGGAKGGETPNQRSRAPIRKRRYVKRSGGPARLPGVDGAKRRRSEEATTGWLRVEINLGSDDGSGQVEKGRTQGLRRCDAM